MELFLLEYSLPFYYIEYPDMYIPERAALPAWIPSHSESHALNLINIERRKYYLHSLVMNSKLSRVSKVKSLDMAAYNDLSHYSARFGGDEGVQLRNAHINYRYYVANIYRGNSNPIQSWMNSPGHREHVLDPNIIYIGITRSVSPSTNNSYWSMIGTASV